MTALPSHYSPRSKESLHGIPKTTSSQSKVLIGGRGRQLLAGIRVSPPFLLLKRTGQNWVGLGCSNLSVTRPTFLSVISDMEIEEVYHDVKQIHYTHRISEANAYLELGWRLLKVLAKRDKDEFAGFVLGWPQNGLAQHPKEDFSDSAP